MKNSKFFGKLSLFLLLWACNTEIKKEKQAPKIQMKNIHFKGLEVKHRFSMPAKYLDDEADAKFISAVAHNNSQSLLDYAMEDVAEIAKEVFKRFPYPSEDKNFTTDIAMIKRDFPKLNEKEIAEKDSLIERYYDVNLDYEVLQILKKTKNPLKKKEEKFVLESKAPDGDLDDGGDGGGYRLPPYDPNCSTKRGGYGSKALQYTCVTAKVAAYGYSPVPVLGVIITRYNYVRAAYSVVTSILDVKAANFNGGHGPNDAKRHIYFSALLALNYYTKSSKISRIQFSKMVGDAYEECGNNNVDASEMDEHNNAIGREVFSQNTEYEKFLTITYGLKLPSKSTLKREAENKVNNDKQKAGDGGKTNNKKICYRKHWIENIDYYGDKNKPVILEDKDQ